MADDKCIIYCEPPPLMGGGPSSGSKGSGSGDTAVVSTGKFKNIDVTETGTIKKIKNKLFLGNQVDTYLLNVTKMSGFTLDVGNNCLWYGADARSFIKWRSTEDIWETQGVSYKIGQKPAGSDTVSNPADAIGVRTFDSTGLTWTWTGTTVDKKVHFDAANDRWIFQNIDLRMDNTTMKIFDTQTFALSDPIFVIGGVTGVENDGMDRGINFKHKESSVAKDGFIGYRESDNRLIYAPEVNNITGHIVGLNTDSYGNYIYGDMELNEIYCYGIKQEKSNRDFLLQSARGIDIKALGTTAADDINIIAEASINITAKETVSNAIDITATNGGINILSTGTNLGDDIDITSTTSINLNAIIVRANNGGIDIVSSGNTVNDDIDVISATSINLTANENTPDAIVLTATHGGIDIVSTSAADNDDIDIRAYNSVNISADEDVADAITLTTTSGGIDITANGSDVGQDIDITSNGCSINLTSTENVPDAITLTTTAGGMDFTATGTAGEDIDITANGSSINLTSTENIEDAIVLKATNGGLDIQTKKNIDLDTSDGLINIGCDNSNCNINIGVSGVRVITLGSYSSSVALESQSMNLIVQNDITVASDGGIARFASSKEGTGAVVLTAPKGGVDITDELLNHTSNMDVCLVDARRFIRNLEEQYKMELMEQ